MNEKRFWRSFELKIILIILFVALTLPVTFYQLIYGQYYKLTISGLQDDARIVHQFVEDYISESSFTELNTREDESKEIYIETHRQLNEIRRIANILYLYTAKLSDDGTYIYVLDGLDADAEDFRHVGDPIEDEIIPQLEMSLGNQVVMGDKILVTDWGIVYVAYFPVHDSKGNVIGAIGMEFDCENLHNTFVTVRALTLSIAFALMLAFSLLSIVMLRRVVTKAENELKHKDMLLIAATEEAIESSKAKSEFLSRMSHEIRTPMNAIIGMTKIADSTDDVQKLRYCLSTIGASSAQLLGLINDILDMSKIESGKFELDHSQINIEKILMKVCNLLVDKTEQKGQRFDVELARDMGVHYMGDELRLSQVLTNLLSNAVKFTPELGKISLLAEERERTDGVSTLRFTVKDSGIGMTAEQRARLFTSFVQADDSIARKFGGTGLGLAISKSIVEKMGGTIWVDSIPGKGSSFTFEVKLERISKQERLVIYGGISPQDLKTLVVDDDDELRERFLSVMDGFGIPSLGAHNGTRAIEIVSEAKAGNKPFDVIFIDYDLPDMDGLETANRISRLADKNTFIIMTSFLEWHKIEADARRIGVTRFIPKPLFPSSILDAINEVIGGTAKSLELASQPAAQDADFNGISMLLVEDIEINREIFVALLEGTGVSIDTAENGLVAVNMFKKNPEKYDLIVMDVQMPELDGYGATSAIRALDAPRAKTIPIVAMTANAFKEDVDKCLACGMNDHLSKPIDQDAVIEKLRFYAERARAFRQ